MQLKQKERLAGYDAEELYFEKLNRELINKIKAKTGPAHPNQPQNMSPSDNVIPFPQARSKQEKKAA